jgi:hypothetical protein
MAYSIQEQRMFFRTRLDALQRALTAGIGVTGVRLIVVGCATFVALPQANAAVKCPWDRFLPNNYHSACPLKAGSDTAGVFFNWDTKTNLFDPEPTNICN